MSRLDPGTDLPATAALYGLVCVGVAVAFPVFVDPVPSAGDGFGAGFAGLMAFIVGISGLVLVGYGVLAIGHARITGSRSQ